MGEIRRYKEGKRGRPKDVKIHGSKDAEPKGVEIVGGSPGGTSGPLKILDKSSPVEPTHGEIHIHPDKKSFEEATEKDQ
jgi:hypothetical protein